MKLFRYIGFVSCVIFSSFLRGQEIITVDFEVNISRLSGNLVASSLGVNVSFDTGVDLFRVTYTTTGSDGDLDVASGLLILPDIIDRDLPILVYQHGTTSGRSDVPSELDGGFQLAALFAAKGMIVVAPDYLGMGTSRGFHPYVHARTEATAAVDFVHAIQSFLQESEIEWNEQLFVTGYSQGGHGAMAFHNYVQEQIPDEFEITASLPMSGPYDVSGIMKDLAFRDEIYGFPSYIVYSTLGLQAINPSLYEDESQIFKAPYLDAIRQFKATGEDLFVMNQSLIATLIAETGRSVPREMFKDSVLTVILENDDHPFNVGLRESDLYDWTPEAPVLMLYCRTDDQVPFTNTLLADSLMNLNGAPNVSSQDVSEGQNLDHTDCIVPALNVGIPWLLGFIDQPTPVVEIDDSTTIDVFPNPTSDILFIQSGRNIDLIEIYSISGQRVLSQAVSDPTIELRLGHLSSGIYVVRAYTENGVIARKVNVLRS